MFMSGTLSIDPSQLTHIRRTVPQKIFKRLLFLLTVGLVSDKQEHETFTAISILQQLQACLHSLGVTNVIRLAKDGTDIYHDVAGLADDMDEAMDAFVAAHEGEKASLFETLRLVMEHKTEQMAFLIEIRVNRTHDVGTYPIEIEVNAVPNEFHAAGAGASEIWACFSAAMETQQAYSHFVMGMKRAFSEFFSGLERAIKDGIKVDHVIRDSKPVMIRPGRAYTTPEELPLHIRFGRPFFHGYFGWQEASFYAFHWARYVHTMHFHVSDFILVDDGDETLMSVGPIGFEAGYAYTLSYDGPFEPPTGGDIALPKGSSDRQAVPNQPQRKNPNDRRGWFDMELVSETLDSEVLNDVIAAGEDD